MLLGLASATTGGLVVFIWLAVRPYKQYPKDPGTPIDSLPPDKYDGLWHPVDPGYREAPPKIPAYPGTWN